MKRDSKSNRGNEADFIRTARELGCDESEAAFVNNLKKLATVKPMTNVEVKRKAKKRGNK